MEIFLTIITLSISFGVTIFLFLNTNFVIEYYNLFKLNGIKILDEYNKKNKNGYICSFPDFLINEYDNFFINLITCPVCLSIWLSIMSIIFVGKFFLLVSFLTLISYFLLKIMYNLQK